MKLHQFFIEAVENLSALYPYAEARAMVVKLLIHFCDISRSDYIVHPNMDLPPKCEELLTGALKRLLKSEPLQYVLGIQDFCGLKIEVQKGVLIPRPETEELVEWAIESLIDGNFGESPTILDAACGSGAITTALARSLPGSVVYGCDISERALALADKNLGKFTTKKGRLFKCNLLSDSDLNYIIKQLPKFDLIISNPPYVTESEKRLMRPNVLLYEPEEALFVPDDNPLLFYKALEKVANGALMEGGVLLLEINERFPMEVAALFDNKKWRSVEVRNDINSKARMVKSVKI